MLTSFENAILCQLRKAAMSAPEAAPEPIEPPVCTLFEHCKGCPYHAHGFICWGAGRKLFAADYYQKGK